MHPKPGEESQDMYEMFLCNRQSSHFLLCKVCVNVRVHNFCISNTSDLQLTKLDRRPSKKAIDMKNMVS